MYRKQTYVCGKCMTHFDVPARKEPYWGYDCETGEDYALCITCAPVEYN